MPEKLYYITYVTSYTLERGGYSIQFPITARHRVDAVRKLNQLLMQGDGKLIEIHSIREEHTQ